MTKRSKKKSSPKKKKPGKSVSQIEYLGILIDYSLKAADGASEELDSLFTNQAKKIGLQIEKLKGIQ